MEYNIKNAVMLVIGAIMSIILLMVTLFCISWSYREYSVWSSNMQGRSLLAYANQERQVLVAQAKAKLDASKFDAEAEIQKAKGIAQSNRIIGQSLNKNPAYLTWKYYEVLENTHDQVIYVSTKDNVPITESLRLVNNKHTHEK